MLAAKNLVSYFSSMGTLSGFDSRLMSTASILLLVIIMAARLLSTGEVQCRLDFGNPTILFLYWYGSCIKIISELSCSVSFIKLSVAVLECCKFISLHLIVGRGLVFLCPCVILLLLLTIWAILVVRYLPVFNNHRLQAGAVPIE